MSAARDAAENQSQNLSERGDVLAVGAAGIDPSAKGRSTYISVQLSTIRI